MSFGHIDDDFEAKMDGERDADFLEPLQGDGLDEMDTVEISSTLEDLNVTSEELRDQHRRKTGVVLEWSDEHDDSVDL